MSTSTNSNPGKMSVSSSTRHKSKMSSFGSVNGFRKGMPSTNKPPPQKPLLQVLNASGADVTPRSLIDPGRRKTIQEAVSAKKFSVTESRDLAGIPKSMAINSKMFANETQTTKNEFEGPFSKSYRGSQAEGSTSQPQSRIGSLDDFAEDLVSHRASEQFLQTRLGEIQMQRRVEVEENLTDTELNKMVTISLTETSTIDMFEQVGTWVQNDAEEAPRVREENVHYQAVVSQHKDSQDSLFSRGVQTLHGRPKHKEAQMSLPQRSESGTQCSDYELHEVYAVLEEKLSTAKETAETVTKKAMASFLGAIHRKPTMLPQRTTMHPDPRVQLTVMKDMGFGIISTDHDASSHEPPPADWEHVSQQPALEESLALLERLVTHTIYMNPQYEYRGLPPVPSDVLDAPPSVLAAHGDTRKTSIEGSQNKDRAPSTTNSTITTTVTTTTEMSVQTDEGERPHSDDGLNVTGNLANKVDLSASSRGLAIPKISLHALWTFRDDSTKTRPVACMKWNPFNRDILAAGYGSLEFSGENSGVVLCWSLKNPDTPERRYEFGASVTSLDFSALHPNILAVGTRDGNVHVFDVSSNSDKAIVDTRDKPSSARHSMPVWDMQWIFHQATKDDEKTERLVTTSTDGKVMQWVLRKGLDETLLMTIRRVTKNMERNANAKTAFMARQGGALSLRFSPVDPLIYVIGTEDGSIHKCSTSYNEQFLTNYFGHTASIYRLRWFPHTPDLFASCSADWDIRLWHHGDEQPLRVLKANNNPVVDLEISPHHPSVMASISEKSLAIWDLLAKGHDPVFCVDTPGASSSYSCLSFSPTPNVLLTGNSHGQITVNHVAGLGIGSMTLEEQSASLIASLTSKK